MNVTHSLCTDLDTFDSISQLLSVDVVLEDESATSNADPVVGTIFAAKYRVGRVLGRGGMGVVYEVEHVGIGRTFAMKLLAGPLAEHPTIRRRFRLEALAASRLESPHTVQVFDFGVWEGRAYLVMERVQGESMSAILTREGPMPERRVAQIAMQVCSALAEAHAMGVIHRDIKPDNVMIRAGADGRDHAKVLDFGLAKVHEPDGVRDATTRGTILGTPHYMAPEQILAEEIDGRADVYALGALMYRALTGSHLFNGKATEVITQQLTATPVPIHEHPRGAATSPAMRRIVMGALVKDRAARTASVEALRTELAVALETLELGADDGPAVAGWLDTPSAPAEAGGEQRTRRLAIRDELDQYERRLGDRRYGWVVFALATLLALAAIAVMVYGQLRGAG
ncbi:MAG TPA: serine/threonine-protein kinase [Polyangiaceae bacterium]|nr:serine/threonine-protein kinase [Polyangiaceae bacterium]